MDFATGWDGLAADDSMYSLNSSHYSSGFSAALEALPLETTGSSFVAADDCAFTYPALSFPPYGLSCVPITPPATSRASPSPTASSSHSRRRGSVSDGKDSVKRVKLSPQDTPLSTLSEPATILCEAWLENFPSVFPKAKHIRALTDLTDESGRNIERWLNQRMRQSSGQARRSLHHVKELSTPPKYDPLQLSPTAFYPLSPITAESSSPPLEVQSRPSVPTLRAAALREASHNLSCSNTSVGRHCVPTTSSELLARDPSKPFQCTHKCGARFAQRDDWRKHEERRAPQEGWLCLVASCKSSTSSMSGCEKEIDGRSISDDDGNTKGFFCGRPSYRRQHFRQHFKRLHSHLVGEMGDYEELGYFKVVREFEERCGFCLKRVRDWREWVAHVGKHFQEGAEVRRWKEGVKGERSG